MTTRPKFPRAYKGKPAVPKRYLDEWAKLYEPSKLPAQEAPDVKSKLDPSGPAKEGA